MLARFAVAGTNLLQIAVHEIGHALGLDHSPFKNAVMHPYYYYKENFTMDPDDIQGIQAIYGTEAIDTFSNHYHEVMNPE